MKKVVNVKTQAEWDFVTEKLGYKWTGDWWPDHKENSYIRQNEQLRGNIKSLLSGDIIISFEDWCKENNYTFTKTYTKDDFVVDKWYTCSCNSNYYQFDGYLTTDKFGSKAVINPTKISHANAKPGYTKRISHEACLEYFSPDNLVDEFLIQQYLSKDIEPTELLIVGEIYRVDDKYGYWNIMKLSKINDKDNLQAQELINSTNKYRLDCNVNILDRSYKLATPEEKEWLEYCLTQGKYIDQDKVPKKLSPFELLEIAKKRYPIGKTFKVNQSNSYGGSGADVCTIYPTKDSDYIIADSPNDNIIYKNVSICGIGVFHTKYNVWAEILEEVKEVAKESIEPEYVECIGENVNIYGNPKKGVIYKVVNRRIQVIDNRGPEVSSTYGKQYFKPSTKEAYEAQNKFKEESMKGRYLKALVDRPNGGVVEKGEYGLFIDNCVLDFPSQKGYLFANFREQLGTKVELMPIGFNPNTIDSKWIPKVGDWVVMENAGGWSYHPDNNGCIAMVEAVNPREANNIQTYGISGTVINPRINRCVNFDLVPIESAKGKIVRLATTLEIAKATNEPVYSGKDIEMTMNTKADIFNSTSTRTVYMDITDSPTKEIPLNLPKEKVILKPLLNIKLEQVKLINF